MHPADEIRGSTSLELKDKTIVLGVTGSIAAVESIRLARELIRHGATIIPVMTPAATRIIHPDALWFATGNSPIVDLSGETEHITWCGRGRQKADALLISPCTANTISKITYGIDDTAVTTFATTAIGSSIPIIIVPAMHLAMYDHQIVQDNVTMLKKQGIVFVDPLISDNKAKMASLDRISLQIRRVIGPGDMRERTVLIIGGGTAEPIDDVRMLCNRSSGAMAMSLVRRAYERGADVECWYGKARIRPPEGIDITNFYSLQDVNDLVDSHDMDKYDIIIICAALSDYIPKRQKEKISSDQPSMKIQCSAAPKLLPALKEKAKEAFIVGFKLESNTTQLLNRAKQMRAKYDIDLVIANTTKAIDEATATIWIIDDSNSSKKVDGTKTQLADGIYDTICSKI